MPSKKPSLTIRIPSDIKDTLEKLAEKEDRSLGSMVTVILREFFEKTDNKKATDFLSSEEIEKINSLSPSEKQAIIEKLSSNNKQTR